MVEHGLILVLFWVVLTRIDIYFRVVLMRIDIHAHVGAHTARKRSLMTQTCDSLCPSSVLSRRLWRYIISDQSIDQQRCLKNEGS
eukprot:scaffold1029_cov194-Amphora_coffeaeformis.AAC.15